MVPEEERADRFSQWGFVGQPAGSQYRCRGRAGLQVRSVQTDLTGFVASQRRMLVVMRNRQPLAKDQCGNEQQLVQGLDTHEHWILRAKGTRSTRWVPFPWPARVRILLE